MINAVTRLRPKKVWEFFADISKIPRTSGNEKQIVDHLAYLFKKFKAKDVYRDQHHNVIAHFPASTSSYTNHRMITLQAHSDMVGAKLHSSNHNFLKDPIILKKNKEYVFANNTTLGADNGIGVAMILAIVSDKNIKHGPLEVVITSDEEEGQTGVKNLDKSKLHGKHLISLDGYDENLILIGSASVIITTFEIPVSSFIEIDKDAISKGGPKNTALKRIIEIGKKAINDFVNVSKEISISKKNSYLLGISHLKGGHVALQLNNQFMIENAIKEVFYILHKLSKHIDFTINMIKGGQNAGSMPTECECIISVNEKDEKILHKIFNDQAEWLKKYYKDETNAKFTLRKVDINGSYITQVDSLKVINIVNSLYNGICGFDDKHNHTYNGAAYVSVVNFDGKKVNIVCGQRATTENKNAQSASRLISLCDLLKLEYKMNYLSVAWTPDYENNKVGKLICEEMNKNLKNKPATLSYTLGGCEAATILKYENFKDGVLWGPNIEQMHSPHERVSIKSVDKCFNALCEVIKKLK